MSQWPPTGLERFAEALPFEHLLRGRTSADAVARWRCEAQTSGGGRRCRVALMVEPGSDPTALPLTLASWALQTWPDAPWIGFGLAAGAPVQCGGPPPLACIDSPASLAALDVDWIVPAVAGDVLHPSLAWAVARAAAGGAGLVAWDWLEADEQAVPRQPKRLRRGPARDGVAELATDRRGRAFAAPLRCWRTGPRHPQATRFSVARGTPTAVHGEPLGFYPASAHSGHGEGVSAYWDAPFEMCPRGSRWPALPARSVAVVILYRDRGELTCRAIRSAAMQRLAGQLELVLLDHDSGVQTGAQVAACLAEIPAHVSVTRLEHSGAFNHSLQVGLAAAATRAEVLVLLNNDAEFVDEDAVDRLSRWARLEGVASAGGHAVDELGRSVGGGFHARAAPGPEFNSPVEEARAEAAAFSRETIGNSFACAAISAEAFHALGGLDAAWFPAGYNDVDYSLRAVARGWTHVTLADVRYRHAVGATRPRQDEVSQKLLLRERHPWVAGHAARQWSESAVQLPPLPGDLLPSSRHRSESLPT